MPQKIKHSIKHGFTIIETMFVLAIAGLILVVILMGTSEGRKMYRDHQRKQYADSIMAATVEFWKNNKILPSCWPNLALCPTAQTKAENFLSNYLPKGTDPTTGQSYNSATVAEASYSFCNGSDTLNGNVVYCWHETPSHWINHNLQPRVGQAIIAPIHVCGSGVHGGFGTIKDTNGGDDSPANLAILIGLERGGPYCISNDAEY